MATGATDSLNAINSNVTSAMDAMAARAKAKADVTAKPLQSGASEAGKAAADAQSQLEALLKETAKLTAERAERADGKNKPSTQNDDDKSGSSEKPVGTFSAAAAFALGFSGGPIERTAKASERTAKATEAIAAGMGNKPATPFMPAARSATADFDEAINAAQRSIDEHKAAGRERFRVAAQHVPSGGYDQRISQAFNESRSTAGPVKDAAAEEIRKLRQDVDKLASKIMRNKLVMV
jgi:hypothetical protein